MGKLHAWTHLQGALSIKMRDDRRMFNVESPAVHHMQVDIDLDKCRPANPVLESKSSRGLLPPTISPGTDIDFRCPRPLFRLIRLLCLLSHYTTDVRQRQTLFCAVLAQGESQLSGSLISNADFY